MYRLTLRDYREEGQQAWRGSITAESTYTCKDASCLMFGLASAIAGQCSLRWSAHGSVMGIQRLLLSGLHMPTHIDPKNLIQVNAFVEAYLERASIGFKSRQQVPLGTLPMNLYVRNNEEASVEKDQSCFCLSGRSEGEFDRACQTFLLEINVKVGFCMGGNEVIVVR